MEDGTIPTVKRYEVFGLPLEDFIQAEQNEKEQAEELCPCGSATRNTGSS